MKYWTESYSKFLSSFPYVMDESLHSAEKLRVSRILFYMTEFIIPYHKSHSVHLHDRKKHKKSLTFNSKYNSKFASLQSFVISQSMAVPRLPYPILQSTTAFTRGSQIQGGSRRGHKLSVCWSTDGMILTGEKRSIGERPVPLPLCPSQSSQWPNLKQTQASAVKDRRLTRLSRGAA